MNEETQEALAAEAVDNPENGNSTENDTAATVSETEVSKAAEPMSENVEFPNHGNSAQFDFSSLSAHYASLRAEAAALGIDFDEALSDPRFVRLTAPGMGVSAAAAWHALHAEDERAAARQALAGAVSAGRERPREGGGSGAALLASDPRGLSPQNRAALKQRIFDAAARGQKIYP